MSKTSLSRWLKVIIIGVAVCGALAYFRGLPQLGLALLIAAPEFTNRFWPWLVFLWLTGVPCGAALVFLWKIAGSIGLDRAFTAENGRRFLWISRLAAADTLFFLVGNVVLFLLELSHPSVLLLSLLLILLGGAAVVVFAGLAHLTGKAAALQEQSDWTI